MARRELDYRVDTEGRDKGKVFHITEMPCEQAEKWALQAILAIARSGVDVDPVLFDAGMEGLAILGVQSLTKLAWKDAEPLLDEMFQCVAMKPNPQTVRELAPGDIEEVATRILLRWEALKLHVGFSQVVGEQISPQSTSTTTSTTAASSSTPTSPRPSEPLYHPARPRRQRSPVGA